MSLLLYLVDRFCGGAMERPWRLGILVIAIYSAVVVMNRLVADMTGVQEDETTVELIDFTNKTTADYELTTRLQEPEETAAVGVAYVQEGIGVWGNPIIVEAGKTTKTSIIVQGIAGTGQQVRLRPTCGGSLPTYYIKRGPTTSGSCALNPDKAPHTFLVSRNIDFAEIDDAQEASCRYPIHTIAYCGNEFSTAAVRFDADHLMIEPRQNIELLDRPVHPMTLEILSITGDGDDDSAATA